MENSTLIKDRILQIAELKKINKSDFFDSINQSYANYRGKSKTSSPSSEVLVEISTVYPDINILWILTGEGSPQKELMVQEPSSVYSVRTDKIQENQIIPLFDIQASAGLVELFQDTKANVPVDTLQIPNLPKCDGAVYVTGDSMYPLLKSGDIVIYKEIQDILNNIFWGEMYLISIDMDGEEYISVKFLQKSELGDEYIKLVSQNSHHQAKDISLSKVRALAIVKASIRINSMG